MEFELDGRLASDSIAIGSMALCDLRLMNDMRWPWLMLVPRRTGAVEIHDLMREDIFQLAAETALTSQALKQFTGCMKINTAAIGNIVRQLHIHVIARDETDPNWPGPVWGHGQRLRYEKAEREATIAGLTDALGSHFV